MQMMMWISLVAIVWLVPMVACALERGLLGRAAALLAQGRRGRSVAGQLFLIAFAMVFVIRGGAKQARSSDQFGMRNSELTAMMNSEFGVRNSELMVD